MANPKKRKTHSAVGKNRAHLALKKTTLNACEKCGQPKEPHKACRFCGAYKGKDAVKTKAVKVKK
jgi:large subunit ribosomal protein L32